MATARLDMRLDEDVKAKAEKAAALLGHKSLTEYVVSLMSENATQVIAEHESVEVSDTIFDRFLEACHKAEQPNTALQTAAQIAKEQGF